jgi:zinc and cadmium transporter
MDTFWWILLGGVLMSVIALVGGVTLLFEEATLNRIIVPLVAFAAGSFLYIGASDLVPEVNENRDVSANVIHFGSFVAGIALLWAIRIALRP